MKKISLAISIMFIILAILQVGILSATTIAVLPFHSMGIDEISIQTAESILKNDLQKLSSMNIIPRDEVIEALNNELIKLIKKDNPKGGLGNERTHNQEG